MGGRHLAGGNLVPDVLAATLGFGVAVRLPDRTCRLAAGCVGQPPARRFLGCGLPHDFRRPARFAWAELVSPGHVLQGAHLGGTRAALARARHLQPQVSLTGTTELTDILGSVCTVFRRLARWLKRAMSRKWIIHGLLISSLIGAGCANGVSKRHWDVGGHLAITPEYHAISYAATLGTPRLAEAEPENLQDLVKLAIDNHPELRAARA